MSMNWNLAGLHGMGIPMGIPKHMRQVWYGYGNSRYYDSRGLYTKQQKLTKR